MALDQPARDRFRAVARFGDRVAIVTGAGAPGGIGAAVARAIVADSAQEGLAATSERGDQRAAELGDAAVGVIADLTVDGAADTLVRAALHRWGRVNVLVNNAGMTSVHRGGTPTTMSRRCRSQRGMRRWPATSPPHFSCAGRCC